MDKKVISIIITAILSFILGYLVRLIKEAIEDHKQTWKEKKEAEKIYRAKLACRPHLWERYDFKPTQAELSAIKKSSWSIDENGKVIHHNKKKHDN